MHAAPHTAPDPWEHGSVKSPPRAPGQGRATDEAGGTEDRQQAGREGGGHTPWGQTNLDLIPVAAPTL